MRAFDDAYTEELASLMEELVNAIDACFDDGHSTYKHHMLEHIPLFIREFGCIYELGTASLESSYRLQKNAVPMSNTRRQGGIAMMNHAYSTKLLAEVGERARRGSVCCVTLMESTQSSHMDRIMKPRIPLLNNYGFVSPRDLIGPNHRPMTMEEGNSLTLLRHAAHGFDRVYKRVLFDGSLYESRFHPNSRRKETQRCIMIVENANSQLVPCKFEFCAVDLNGDAVIVVQVFDSSDPFQRLRRDLQIRRDTMPAFRTPDNDAILALLRICVDSNDCYYEFTSDQGTRDIMRIEQIKGPAQVGSFAGRSFAVNCKAKAYHE